MPFYRYSSDEYKKLAEASFITMQTPVDFLKEIGVSRNYQQLNILGKAAILIGSAFLLFLLVPNNLGGQIGVLFISGFSLVIGSLLLWGAKVEKRKSLLEAQALAALQSQDKP